MSSDEPLCTLRTLVERRAWGDVLQVATDLLTGPDSQYAPLYSSMLADHSNNNDNNNNNINNSVATGEGGSESIKDETAEIVALQCHAWLKLRRYTDLGNEIQRWNFLPYNDHDVDNPPSWVPWSLC